jgi:hypothetical protein
VSSEIFYKMGSPLILESIAHFFEDRYGGCDLPFTHSLMNAHRPAVHAPGYVRGDCKLIRNSGQGDSTEQAA